MATVSATGWTAHQGPKAIGVSAEYATAVALGHRGDQPRIDGGSYGVATYYTATGELRAHLIWSTLGEEGTVMAVERLWPGSLVRVDVTEPGPEGPWLRLPMGRTGAIHLRLPDPVARRLSRWRADGWTEIHGVNHGYSRTSSKGSWAHARMAELYRAQEIGRALAEEDDHGRFWGQRARIMGEGWTVEDARRDPDAVRDLIVSSSGLTEDPQIPGRYLFTG